MSAEVAEPTLIDQIRRGDARTWNDFIAAYEGRLAAFVRARLADPATVDDVVQETFVGFLLSLPNYDPSPASRRISSRSPRTNSPIISAAKGAARRCP